MATAPPRPRPATPACPPSSSTAAPAPIRPTAARASRGHARRGAGRLAGARRGRRRARRRRGGRARARGPSPLQRRARLGPHLATAPSRWTPRSWRAIGSSAAPSPRSAASPTPVTLARRVLEDGPPRPARGDGALAFARAVGVPECDPASLITERQRGATPSAPARLGGTVGAVALDRTAPSRPRRRPAAWPASARARRRQRADRLRHLRRQLPGRCVVHRRRRGDHPRRPRPGARSTTSRTPAIPTTPRKVAVDLLVEEGRGQGGLILARLARPRRLRALDAADAGRLHVARARRAADAVLSGTAAVGRRSRPRARASGRDLRDALRPTRRRSPELTGARCFVKLENLQMTGSFKERGAPISCCSSTTPSAPRRRRRQRRQPRPGRRLPRRAPRDPGADRHAGVGAAHQGHLRAAVRRRGHPARRQLRRGLRAGARARGRAGPRSSCIPSTTRGHRRPGHARARAPRAGARTRRDRRPGRRRRPHRRRRAGVKARGPRSA